MFCHSKSRKILIPTELQLRTPIDFKKGAYIDQGLNTKALQKVQSMDIFELEYRLPML